MDWLTTLEEKVHAAAERIQSLQDENRSLQSRLAALEKQLAAAKAAAPTAPSDAAAQRWEEEKREIRDRVERLTRTLEELAEG